MAYDAIGSDNVSIADIAACVDASGVAQTNALVLTVSDPRRVWLERHTGIATIELRFAADAVPLRPQQRLARRGASKPAARADRGIHV